MAAAPGAMVAAAGSIPVASVVIVGFNAMVSHEFTLFVTVAVVLAIAPVVAKTPSHIPKPPPFPLLAAFPASNRSAMPVSEAFTSLEK